MPTRMLTRYRRSAMWGMAAASRPVAQQVARRVTQAVARRARARGGRDRTESVATSGAVAENTFQHDVQRVYRRRRAPRRVVRRARRNARRVNTVLDARLPQRTFVKTTTRFQTAAVDQQGYSYSIALGVNTPQRTEGNDDLGDIVRQTSGGSSTAPAPARNSNKVFVRSYQLENIIRNLSPVLCFLDVYRVVCRRDLADTDDNGTADLAMDIQALLERGFESEDANVGWDEQRIFKHGVTPFQSPMFTSHFKILSKVRYRLEGGATIQLHMRGKVNKTFDYDKNRNIVYKRGWSQGLVFIWYGAPGSTTAEGIYSQACNLRIVRNLQYNYKVLQSASDNIGNYQQVVLAT